MKKHKILTSVVWLACNDCCCGSIAIYFIKCHNIKVSLYHGGLTYTDSVVYNPISCRELYRTEAAFRTMVESGTCFFQGYYSVINVLLLLGVIVMVQIIESVNHLLQRTWFYMY